MNKKLVDANTIGKEYCCCKPEPGDLVRIRRVSREYLAICNKYFNYTNGELYYSTQDGKMYNQNDVKVLEILGKCVFSLYV